MEADLGQRGTAQQRLELESRDVAAPQRLAGRVGEDQVVARQPATGRPCLLLLSIAMRAQDIEGRVGQLDRALALGGLGLTQPPPPVEADKCVADEDAPGRLVDVAPAQPEQPPWRMPVVTASVNSASSGWPWASARRRRASSGLSGRISGRLRRGSAAPVAGLRSMSRQATAWSSAPWRTAWAYRNDAAERLRTSVRRVRAWLVVTSRGAASSAYARAMCCGVSDLSGTEPSPGTSWPRTMPR